VVPTPAQLYVRVKNTSAIPLRAAYLHGPYTLYAACYPATFDPNSKYDGVSETGNPQFEPHIKAGGSWNAQLKIPDGIRETITTRHEPSEEDEGPPSVTWIIEVSSQILFSSSANVHYEVVVGRDEKSIDFGFAGLMGNSNSIPGQLADHQKLRNTGKVDYKGIYSKAITLVVEDTTDLWNKPKLPHWIDKDGNVDDTVNSVLAEADPKSIKPEQDPSEIDKYKNTEQPQKAGKKKKIHLVVITHGLHSNLGADMLYLKESIDAAAKQARLDAKMRKAKERPPSAAATGSNTPTRDTPSRPSQTQDQKSVPPSSQQDLDDSDNSDDEEVIVRGFSGNATRTERGIQYLGKRLAKYVLSVTYPDQPYLPLKKVKSPLAKAFSSNSSQSTARNPSHHGSSISKEEVPTSNLAYQITSISFIGHSLGGLTQTYAIAYIHKHSPEFFERIKPINFIALASPFLGLSNENPIYVKFALDFGLVGRTGQDLGLTWRAPTIARSGWSAMIAGIGTEGQRSRRQLDPGSKPLLRILPAGPAHQVLRLFRNRTVYSNVVNDGVVPLRTSCLLFLDWRGLGRVEKARRENGLVGTVMNWGWAEMTGTNASEHQKFKFWFDNDFFANSEQSGDEGALTPRTQAAGTQVPQPAENATQDDDGVAEPQSPEAQQFLSYPRSADEGAKTAESVTQPSSPLAGFLNLFKTGSKQEPKPKKIYRRGQTVHVRDDDELSTGQLSPDPKSPARPGMARGDSVLNDQSVFAPPTTSLFESATDILNPPIPSLEYLNDPTSRPRTIFHDRIYHPNDIPPPPVKKRHTLRRNQSGEGRDSINSRRSTMSIESNSSAASIETGSMKVEEKIARAYHRDLSWRKVLVRLEPDAHNNIVVRRMFANAYGWPVVKHLVDTHFADSFTARTSDSLEPNTERAQPMDVPVGEHGEEVKEKPKPRRASTGTLNPEARDSLGELSRSTISHSNSTNRPRISRIDSAQWDDRFFTSDSEDDEDEFEPQRSAQPSPMGRVFKESHDNEEDKNKQPARPTIDVNSTKGLVLPVFTTSPKSTTSIGLGKTLDEQIDKTTI
jgi:hypothetical protein